MGFVQQHDEVVHGAEFGQDGAEVPDVVTAVAERGVVERRKPEAVDPQPLQVIESAG